MRKNVSAFAWGKGCCERKFRFVGLIYEIPKFSIQYTVKTSKDVDLNLSSIYIYIFRRTNVKTVIANRWFRALSIIKCYARSLFKPTDRLVVP